MSDNGGSFRVELLDFSLSLNGEVLLMHGQLGVSVPLRVDEL